MTPRETPRVDPALAGVKGTIFDIKKFAIHDGPGIRTTVFLKGCPLRCPWCHNPESWERTPQLVLFPRKCISCGRCAEVCPHKGALLSGSEGLIDRSLCTNCGACAGACPAEARVLNGRIATVQEVIADVDRDRPFYENSGGGMTVSGGEPLAQPSFAIALLQAAKEADLDTALDTSGFASLEVFGRALRWVDLVLFDLKILDSERHRKVIGVGNEVILANLRATERLGVPVNVRVPLVPGYTDDEENLTALAEFAATIPTVQRVELMQYHKMAKSKFERLGLAFPLDGTEAPTLARMESLGDLISRLGVRVHIERSL